MDLAAEQASDLTADRQSQTGPAVLARGGAVRLLEGFEDRVELVLRNSDAGIADAEADDVLGSLKRLPGEPRLRRDLPDRQRDAARVRELERVREQVLEDLADPLPVGDERRR